MTTDHQSPQRISHHRLRGKIKNEHHPRFQRYHSGSQLGTANRRCSPRLGTPYQLMSSMIKTIKKRKQFEIDSPPDKQNTDNYASLKSLIQEIGFTEKTPQYKVCVKFIETISPKSKTSHTDVVDLTSPKEEDDTIDNNNDNLFVKDKDLQQEGETKRRTTIYKKTRNVKAMGRKLSKMESNQKCERSGKVLWGL